MDSTTMNDFLSFISTGDIFPNLSPQPPLAFKLPRSQGFSPLMQDMTHRQGYSLAAHANMAPTVLPFMPVVFSSANFTSSGPMQNAGNNFQGRNTLPLNTQWRWNPAASAPKPSNWPDSSPPQYPALYDPTYQTSANTATLNVRQASTSPMNLGDIQSFFATPESASTHCNLLMSTSSTVNQDDSANMQPSVASRRASLDSLPSLQLPDSFENMGSKKSPSSAPRSATSSDHGRSIRSSPNPPSPQTQPKKKTPKMHSCPICQRAFPRPSGLQVHLNSHNGLKPFTCEFPSCDRKFTVRSNARRHLRTHGVTILNSESEKQSTTTQPGNNPTDSLASTKTDASENISKVLRWIPHSLSGGTQASPTSDRGLLTHGITGLEIEPLTNDSADLRHS